MGAFEERAIGRTALPDDLPNASESAAKYPDGAVYKSSAAGHQGKRFRLRHARWVPVTERKKENGAKKK